MVAKKPMLQHYINEPSVAIETLGLRSSVKFQGIAVAVNTRQNKMAEYIKCWEGDWDRATKRQG
jgi:hypothetical protein